MTDRLRLTDLGIPAESRSALPSEQAERLAATLDLPAVGHDEPPLLWHWVWFTPTARTADLGPDGHHRVADTPQLRGRPRRMFAGGSVRQVAPLRMGAPAVRSARIVDTVEKRGRSGQFLVVRVGYDFHQGGRSVVTEEQTLVYREPGAALPLPVGDCTPQAPPGGWCERHVLDAPILFRFSALTFNTHRIHYDLSYARSQEGYPDLVVHGPLVALLLAESARARMGPLASFEFRATAPLFRGIPFSVLGEVAGGGVTLRAVRNDGQETMRARAVVRA